jgi:protein-tyrosine phosphatase
MLDQASSPPWAHFDSEREVLTLHVLFVCTGNICRSPIAERLTVLLASQKRVPGLSASSAGTRAVVGEPIHRDSAAALTEFGGDPSNFEARQLTPKIALDADLILTMTRSHRDAVLELAPRQLRRTFTLSEAARLTSEHELSRVADLADARAHLPANEVVDVPDPIGRPPHFHATIAAQIAGLLHPVVDFCRRSLATPS